ncbi:MAG: hypothetical protein OXE99_01980, partial [Cellvibrionales bacterium]|nr:hypothetical protein [Cellvibrionales bacterium]
AAVFTLYKLTDLFAIQSLGMVAGLVLRVSILGFIIYCLIKLRTLKLHMALKIAFASVLPILLFYTFYLPAYWFFERYFYWVFIVLIIMIAVVLAEAVSKRIKIAALGLCLAPSLLSFQLYFSQPQTMPSLNLFGPKGYRDAALVLLLKVPAHSHVAAMQSGALNYYSGKDVKVTNLDGVVNHDAYLATKDKSLYPYLNSIGVTHFADWHMNRDILIKETQEKIHLDCIEPLNSLKHAQRDTTLYDISGCMNHEL